MVVELIAKDKQEKFQFQGKCKLIIDSLSKLLLIEPYNEEYKMITAMFKWKFVAQKIILFIFAEYDFQDFALIFDDSIKCNIVYEILLRKKAISGSAELVNERFLPLFFNEISVNNESNLKLKEILFKWIELFDGKEKEELIQILKNYNIYDLIYEKGSDQNQRILRKRKAQNITRKRTFHELNETQDYNNNEKRLYVSTHKLHSETSNFEIQPFVHKGILKKKLCVFISDDKKYCYEYYWRESENCFECGGCVLKKKHRFAKMIKRNRKDIVKILNTQHVCNIREYKAIIEKPNFEVIFFERKTVTSKRLIVFLDSSRTQCFEYIWANRTKSYRCLGCMQKQHSNSAVVYQKEEDGTEIVILKSKEHKCQPRKYNSEKYTAKEIVEAENFKIFENIENGFDNSRLFIFTSAEKNQCYVYYWSKSNKRFYCHGCLDKKIKVGAEVFSKPDGMKYLKLSKKKHLCEPCEYDPDKYDTSKKEIIQSSNFKIFYFQQRGASTSRLIVFCETNKNLCYEYFWKKNKGPLYQCCLCPFNLQMTATVHKNAEGNEYIKLYNTQHVCALVEFDPEKYKDDGIVEKSMYKFISTKLGKVETFLIISTTEEKKYYYKFLYKQQEKYYYCSKCFYSNLLITATIQNEGKENEFLYVSCRKHVCEPFEYSTLTNGNINKAPNFQLLKRIYRDKIIQHMVIFTDDEKTQCFEYAWNEKSNIFKCSPCQSGYKINVYAKIFKNDENEECIELCKTEHKCKPIKFIPENITTKIIKESDFQLVKRKYKDKFIQHLALFSNDEKNECYEYSWKEETKKFLCIACLKQKKIRVEAKILKNDENEDCIELSPIQHQCKPIKFVPENEPSTIIKAPYFKVFEGMNENNKKISKKLAIFDSTKKSMGYIYYYQKKNNYFQCSPCAHNGKSITARILQDENGQDFVKLNKAEHVCELRKL